MQILFRIKLKAEEHCKLSANLLCYRLCKEIECSSNCKNIRQKLPSALFETRYVTNETQEPIGKGIEHRVKTMRISDGGFRNQE